MPDSIKENSCVRPLLDLDGEPVFSEPWQAQALAIADNLVKAGRVTPAAWSSALGAELEKNRNAGEPDNQITYYQSVLAALEKLAVQNLSLSKEEIKNRTIKWKEAYLSTPHGEPVSLD